MGVCTKISTKYLVISIHLSYNQVFRRVENRCNKFYQNKDGWLSNLVTSNQHKFQVCITLSILYHQKVQLNLITIGRVQVSPPLNLHSENDKVPFVGPHHLPKNYRGKAKTTTNSTLYEPPIMIALAYFEKNLCLHQTKVKIPQKNNTNIYLTVITKVNDKLPTAYDFKFIEIGSSWVVIYHLSHLI